ncbi:MAG: gliding motility protein GldL [Paludibacteraceae bacterium]|nr:gliding motility protein GldL [Paludibacteraceae bacterium]
MANQNNPQELKGWDKVVAWYARHSYAVNMVYSLGASVVIVGALFKILHWPGASYVLMVGMFTESFLFMLGIFEKPHAVYNWENVFPQLIGHEEKELLGGNGLPGSEPGKKVDTALPEAELQALKDGIQNLSKTAQQLASIGEMADATAQLKKTMVAAGEGLENATAGLTDNLAKAGKAVDDATASLAGNMGKAGKAVEDATVTLAGNFAKAGQTVLASQEELAKSTQGLGQQYDQLSKTYQTVIADMENVIKGTKACGKGLEEVNAQIASLNSVYELQLKDLNAQSAAFRTQTEKVNGVTATIEQLAQDAKQMQATASQALEAGKQYQSAQDKLAQQIADLNKVYGNMLNALA